MGGLIKCNNKAGTYRPPTNAEARKILRQRGQDPNARLQGGLPRSSNLPGPNDITRSLQSELQDHSGFLIPDAEMAADLIRALEWAKKMPRDGGMRDHPRRVTVDLGDTTDGFEATFSRKGLSAAASTLITFVWPEGAQVEYVGRTQETYPRELYSLSDPSQSGLPRVGLVLVPGTELPQYMKPRGFAHTSEQRTYPEIY